MEDIDVRLLAHARSFPVILAKLQSLIALPHVVVECTYLELVAALLVTLDVLVLVRVVESLDRGVTLTALYSMRADVPRKPFDQRVAIFGCIFENLWRPSKVSHMVSIDTRL